MKKCSLQKKKLSSRTSLKRKRKKKMSSTQEPSATSVFESSVAEKVQNLQSQDPKIVLENLKSLSEILYQTGEIDHQPSVLRAIVENEGALDNVVRSLSASDYETV